MLVVPFQLIELVLEWKIAGHVEKFEKLLHGGEGGIGEEFLSIGPDFKILLVVSEGDGHEDAANDSDSYDQDKGKN